VFEVEQFVKYAVGATIAKPVRTQKCDAAFTKYIFVGLRDTILHNCLLDSRSVPHRVAVFQPPVILFLGLRGCDIISNRHDTDGPCGM
jgi:hypothetical protein